MRKKIIGIELAKHWLARLRAVEQAHFRQCKRFRKYHLVFGTVFVLVSAIPREVEDVHWDVYFAQILAVIVPVLAACASFWSFDTKRQMHHDAAAQFSAMKRELNVGLAKGIEGDMKALWDALESVQRVWDEATRLAPALYEDKWESAISKLEAKIEREFCGSYSTPARKRAAQDAVRRKTPACDPTLSSLA